MYRIRYCQNESGHLEVEQYGYSFLVNGLGRGFLRVGSQSNVLRGTDKTAVRILSHSPVGGRKYFRLLCLCWNRVVRESLASLDDHGNGCIHNIANATSYSVLVELYSAVSLKFEENMQFYNGKKSLRIFFARVQEMQKISAIWLTNHLIDAVQMTRF